MRHDIALQTAVDTDGVLASQSTLCRFEQQADRDWAVAIHEEMIEQFIRSFRRPPKKPLYLDFDATDDRVHGQQLGRHFNGYYNHYIFLPLFVFCGDQLLVSYLRPAYRDAAHHAGAVLALLVRRLRQAWPEVKIVFRGDSGFCRPLILNWCDRHGVDYLIGLAGNKRLAKLALDIDYASAIRFEKTWEKERVFGFIEYAAKSWKERRRRVIAKSETSRRGFNPGVEPQKAWNREVGLRGYIAPLALDYDVAFFSVRVRDELVPYDEGGRTFYQNAGDTNRDGIELALGWQLADQWRLDSALTSTRLK
ncbi:hypothetical protein HMEPL2_33770 [Vreelandella aquamarina]|uniref:Transposase DDE domain-containing protein n=1 Tax=Vreelandella aquamarina TaxID=77097 RepID=A0A6F8XFK4_9GAMM|nr:hypothetical protein HMEPL2_33770 [Halomonas meridiana]